MYYLLYELRLFPSLCLSFIQVLLSSTSFQKTHFLSSIKSYVSSHITHNFQECKKKRPTLSTHSKSSDLLEDSFCHLYICSLENDCEPKYYDLCSILVWTVNMELSSFPPLLQYYLESAYKPQSKNLSLEFLMEIYSHQNFYYLNDLFWMKAEEKTFLLHFQFFIVWLFFFWEYFCDETVSISDWQLQEFKQLSNHIFSSLAFSVTQNCCLPQHKHWNSLNWKILWSSSYGGLPWYD